MSILTDQTNALIQKQVKVMMGTIATAPALLVTDGVNQTWACDVNIGQFDSTGTIDQWKRNLLGIPGSYNYNDYNPDNLDYVYGTILRNVPLARNNASLIYADIGTPVTITRDSNGRWIVDGFTQQQPGTYTMVPVDLSTGTLGPIQDLTTTYRPLTLGELGAAESTFGLMPLGSMGTFGNRVA
jgi:hypothetical protein